MTYSLEEALRKRQEALKQAALDVKREKRQRRWAAFLAWIGWPVNYEKIGLGDWIEFPINSGHHALVVDIDPPDVCTPYPCLMIAWRERGKAMEGVVETKHVRKL